MRDSFHRTVLPLATGNSNPRTFATPDLLRRGLLPDPHQLNLICRDRDIATAQDLSLTTGLRE